MRIENMATFSASDTDSETEETESNVSSDTITSESRSSETSTVHTSDIEFIDDDDEHESIADTHLEKRHVKLLGPQGKERRVAMQRCANPVRRQHFERRR